MDRERENTREIAIRLTGVKKQYKLGQIGGQTLQRELQSLWARLRKKEDPNSKIGVDQRLYGQNFMALNGVDLTVYKGEALGIIGGNGAGKSTLLKLLSRVTAPTEGEIDVYGRVTSMLEVGTGFHGEMTGRENVYMNGAILGLTKREIDQRMEDIIEFSEVREFIDTPVKRYSSGMFVKLAFSVAAHLNSEIMIMDEVLAVGDMSFQQKCLDKMREAAEKEGRTVLYVSHNMNTIRRLCKRCVVLDQGKIIFDGDVDQAIAVYMNHSVKQNEVDMDLTQKSHSSAEELDFGLRMRRLILTDKALPVYEQGEPIRLWMKFHVTKPMENMSLRITFRTESDIAVGTAWSEPFGFDGAGERETQFVLQTDGLKKGVFYVSIGVYRKDELGQAILIDHITRAFKVEITGEPSWSTNAFGYVQFADMSVKLL